jgi:hypothetical protein
MIETTDQLIQAIEQMGRMQRVLESYRRDILPKNPRNFAIFADFLSHKLSQMSAMVWYIGHAAGRDNFITIAPNPGAERRVHFLDILHIPASTNTKSQEPAQSAPYCHCCPASAQYGQLFPGWRSTTAADLHTQGTDLSIKSTPVSQVNSPRSTS